MSSFARPTRIWASALLVTAWCKWIDDKILIRDEAGVVAKFGVTPQSIPDYLAVVGDSADGFPGIAGWGQKSGSRCPVAVPSS